MPTENGVGMVASDIQVNGLKLGYTEEQVVAVLGAPKARHFFPEDQAVLLLYWEKGLDLLLTFLPGEELRDIHAGGELVLQGRYQFGVHDSQARIREALGPPSDYKERSTPGGQSGKWTYQVGDSELSVLTLSGLVYAIYFRRSAGPSRGADLLPPKQRLREGQVRK